MSAISALMTNLLTERMSIGREANPLEKMSNLIVPLRPMVLPYLLESSIRSGGVTAVSSN